MSRQSVSLLSELASAAGAVSATRPSLVTDGADISGSRSGSAAHPYGVILIDADGATDLSSPTGGTAGPEVWGYVRGLWKLLGYLNKGSTLSIVSATQGYAEEVQHTGIATRLAVAATASGGKTATATFVPMETWGL